MAVLRELFKNIDKDGSQRIQSKCISFIDNWGNQTYRIKCGDSTQEFFKKYIQSNEVDINDSTPTQAEEKKIKNNYIYLKDQLIKEIAKLEGNYEKIKYIQEMWDRIDNIELIKIEIENEEGAYEIFETLNARGVELTVADLLKNLIFKKIKLGDHNKRDIVKEKWTTTTNNIYETNTDLKRFIRYFWISKHSFVYDKKLFREIKKTIVNYEMFLNILLDSSELYNKLILCNKNDWAGFKHGEKIFKSLYGIKLMGVTQCYVLFMSILRNFEQLETSIYRVFEWIEKFTFNYSVIYKGPANRPERIYSKYAIDLEEIIQQSKPRHIPGNIQKLFHSLLKDLKNVNPSFAEFEENFMEFSYGRSERNRQLLKYALEKINNTTGTGEFKIDFDKVNIEHILPQNPSEDWGLSKSDIKDYVDKIGNLTLLHKTINAEAGNKSIKDKVDVLSKSEISITKDIVVQLKKSNNKWGENEIKERQTNFAKIAYEQVWSLQIQ